MSISFSTVRIRQKNVLLGEVHSFSIIKLSDLDNISLAIGDAGLKGKGLFSLSSINIDTIIGEYVGEKLAFKDFKARYKNCKSEYIFLLNPDDQRRNLVFIDATDEAKSNYTRFINHDNKFPNLVASIVTEETNAVDKKMKNKNKVIFKTTRHISPNEELTFDYGIMYTMDWNVREEK
jgi:SET domain-containing protein